jgi:thioredoxin-related protein
MKMKNIINTIFFFFLIQVGFSQEVKMITDWNKAKELAKKENKQILIILTGSEWCAPCKKMDKRVIENSEFKKYAEKNLVIFLVDLPGGGLVMNSKVYQDYERFQKKYETKALPSLTLTDKNGIKIKTLKGRMFKLENVLKQLKSE